LIATAAAREESGYQDDRDQEEHRG